MVNTTNLIDRFLDSLRKKAFADFLETNESRIVKAGLICLSYVIPAVSLIAVISLLIRTDLEAGILLIPVAVCVASILLRYAAEKMLGCVKESIDNAKTQISSSSLLDVFTVFIGCFGILVLLASIAGGKNAFYVGIFVFIACEYCMAILLDPTKTINVAIEKDATPADNFLGLFSILVKALYRLVPVAFGVSMFFCVLHLLDIVFVSSGTSVYNLIEPATAALTCYCMALLPLAGYFVFLFSYFTIDLWVSFLQIPKKLDEISKQK